MQYITSGNRIAVENFTLGDLYTITFTSGTYINSACIGIGENFVSFQRNEPELLFTLNMETAELVSSIDLYAGGTGTNNYNELTNKPSIAGVELVGNKSLSDLGIQAEITEESPLSSSLVSGLGSAAAADSSDFATAAQGTLAASAIQSAGSGLSKDGTTLNHSNSVTAKTSEGFAAITYDAQGHITGSTAATTAQLNAINSGITSTDVAQIETNKTNILLLTANGGGKNLLNSSSPIRLYNATYSNGIVTQVTDDTKSAFTFALQGYSAPTTFVKMLNQVITTENGRIRLSFTKDNTFSIIAIGHSGSSEDCNIFFDISNLANGDYYAQINLINYQQSQGKYQFNELMIYDTEYDMLYQPYALSNVELTGLAPTVKDSGTTFTVGTDYTLCDACTLTIPIAGNGQGVRVANIMASLTFNNSAPRGIILSTSNSATDYDSNIKLLAKIESTEYIRLSAQCAFFNYSASPVNIYVWVKSNSSAVNRVVSAVQLLN